MADLRRSGLRAALESGRERAFLPLRLGALPGFDRYPQGVLRRKAGDDHRSRLDGRHRPHVFGGAGRSHLHAALARGARLGAHRVPRPGVRGPDRGEGERVGASLGPRAAKPGAGPASGSCRGTRSSFPLAASLRTLLHRRCERQKGVSPRATRSRSAGALAPTALGPSLRGWAPTPERDSGKRLSGGWNAGRRRSSAGHE